MRRMILTAASPLDPRSAADGIPAGTSTAGSWKRLTLLLALVLTAHLTVAWLTRNGAIRDDAESYVLLGRNLAAGHGYVFQPGGPPTSWRAPGYPVFLASVFRLAGLSGDAEGGNLAGALLLARILQAFLWVLSAFLGYLLARRLVGERTALLAAGLVGFYPEFLGHTGLLWSESLFIPLFLGSILGMLRVSERSGPAALLLAGLLTGAAILTRSTAVVLLPVVWWIAWTRGQRPRGLQQAALFTLAAGVVVGGWALRNYGLHGRIILVESNAAFNLYVGNRPDTPIPFAWRKQDDLDGDPEYEGLVAGRSEGEAYGALSRAAVRNIQRQPFRVVLLAFSKTFDFWLPDFFISRQVGKGVLGAEYARLGRPVLALSVLSFLLVTGAALVGAWRTRGAWETRLLLLILLLYTLPHALVFGASRHHLPLMPLLMLLAAPELLRWGTALARRASGRRQRSDGHRGEDEALVLA